MEHQEINQMFCDELLRRHSMNDPYQNKENKIFAESKITNCRFVDNWENEQEITDEEK